MSTFVLGRETYFWINYYFATLCVPAFVIACFVLYLYVKDRNRRL